MKFLKKEIISLIKEGLCITVIRFLLSGSHSGLLFRGSHSHLNDLRSFLCLFWNYVLHKDWYQLIVKCKRDENTLNVQENEQAENG